MSRSSPWRRTSSDACSWHQDEALNTTIFILRETGPTGFLLKEEGEAKKFKVFLGDPHHCTCATFRKENDLCKHICWVLLKKFKIARQNPVTWQLGLVEREINGILHGVTAKQGKPVGANARRLAAEAGAASENSDAAETGGTVKQRPIEEEDVCPICQEELLAKHLPVTYCKFSCGNSIHIKCMKVWAEHQRTTKPSDADIKCPVCREDFGPFSLLQQEFRNSSLDRANRSLVSKEHLGVKCSNCSVCPIVGKCYKCSSCVEYNLCQSCYITPTHTHHGFLYRERTTQRWKDAPQRGAGGALPEAVATQLMNRELGDDDYDLLLQLDNQAAQRPSDLSEASVKSFPMERIRQNSILLNPGNQCCICLRGYQVGQYVRRLPCRHKFHRECIDNWLLHLHATCPVDGTVFTDSSIKNMQDAERRNQNKRNKSAPQQRPSNDIVTSDLIVGLGVSGRSHQSGNNHTLADPSSGHVNDNRGPQEGSSFSYVGPLTLDGTAVSAQTATDANQTNSFSKNGFLRKLRSRQQSLEAALDAIRQGGDTHVALGQNEQLSGHAVGTHQPLSDIVSRREEFATRTPSITDGALEAVAQLNNPENRLLLNEGLRVDEVDSHSSAQYARRGSSNSVIHGRPPHNGSREPVPPSIPLPYNPSDITLDLGHNHRSVSGPGSASSNSGRSAVKAKDTRARRATGRLTQHSKPDSDRHASSVSNNTLYVGNHPSTSSGVTGEFAVANPRHHSRSHRGQARKDSRQTDGLCHNEVHSDLALAGSALSGLTLNDLVTNS